MTDTNGQMLAEGTITMPFALGADGRGRGSWLLKATDVTNTNQDWLGAKLRLAQGSGELKAKSTDSWLTLDFNPNMRDSNVKVSWDMKKQTAGIVSLSLYAGSYPCALFTLSRTNAQPDGTANRSQHEVAIVGYWQLGDAQSFWEFRADGSCQSHGEIASKVMGRYTFLGRDKVRVDIAGDVQSKILVFSLSGDEMTLSEGQIAMKFHRVSASAMHPSEGVR